LRHLGGSQFSRRDADDLRVIIDWIARETDGGEDDGWERLTPKQQFFADEVLPHLSSRQCMNQACHGSLAPFTSFAPPMELDGTFEFPTSAVRTNYTASRMHLFLGGSPLQSRLIRKGLPLDRGGIAHRGGNNIFFLPPNDDVRSDPAVDAIARWAEIEAAEVVGPTTPSVTAIVFVRGPISPATAFAHDAFNAGTDLFVLEPPEPGGVLRNLTALAHPNGPADIRDPAVSHDGTRVVFSMRLGADEAANIYEIGLDGSGLKQLTMDEGDLPGGGHVANVQPTFGPDGRVYFTSTRAGHLADGYDTLDSEIWAVDRDTLALERLTYDPSPEVEPSFIGVGKTYGTLAFTMRRTIGGRYEAPVFRFPLDHNKAYHGDPEIHIHHGITLDEEIVYGMRTLPDGRFVSSLIGRNNVWRGGRLVVFERQFGPELPRGFEEDAAVSGFRHAFSSLDARALASGISPNGLYRHPVALPDGRLLVSYASGPLDLDDPAANPEFGLYVVTFSEVGEPQLSAIDVLQDEPGIAEYDAEPVLIRPLEDDISHEPAWDESRESDTGKLVFRHVETLEALGTNLEQRGLKPLRDDLVYARFLESLPRTLNEEAAAPVGIGGHVLTRILAEVPLAGGSLNVELPADRPFRVQYLNADLMAVGSQHNRWIHVAPGETFPGGVNPELYPILCASCHGSLSGRVGDVGGSVPDIITAASVTLATHENLDPRRPLEPQRIGDAPVSVDFQNSVAPLLARSCSTSGCHEGATPAAGLDLLATPTASFDSAYEALLQAGAESGAGFRYVESSALVLHRGCSAMRSVPPSCAGWTWALPTEAGARNEVGRSSARCCGLFGSGRRGH
jgi:hypothetical protein